MSLIRNEKLIELASKVIGYNFRDIHLLEEALTHPGFDQEFNYERMEFLGDSILGAIIANMVFGMFPEEKEGALSKRYIALVNKDMLSEIAQELDIREYIIMSESDRLAGIQNSTMANVLEAIIAALYLDGGIDKAENFVIKNWREKALKMYSPPSNFKTDLQEWTQAQKLPLPEYQLYRREGLDHLPIFTISITVQGYPSLKAQGPNKRAAQQEAAKMMLKAIGIYCDS